jgi:hypothetical protein
MSDPIRPDHKGMTTPGTPGDMRYLCPFCDWFLDDGPLGQIQGAPPEAWEGVKTLWPAPGEGYSSFIARFTAAAVGAHNREIERQIEAHLTTHVDEMTGEA